MYYDDKCTSCLHIAEYVICLEIRRSWVQVMPKITARFSLHCMSLELCCELEFCHAQIHVHVHVSVQCISPKTQQNAAQQSTNPKLVIFIEKLAVSGGI